TFTDGDPFAPLSDYTPSVDWGGTLIGTASVAILPVSSDATHSTWVVVGSGTYAEEGLYSVSVTVTDADGSSVSTNHVRFNVAAAPPTDVTVPRTIDTIEESPLTNVLLATYTDGNPFATLSDFTATVDWGGPLDGNPTVSVRPGPGGTWQVV